MNIKKQIKFFVFVVLFILLSISFFFLRNIEVTSFFEKRTVPIELEGAIFVLLYIACTLSFIPRSAASIAGGFMFGVTLGTIYSLIASYIAATLSFLIGRYLGKEWVEVNAKGRILRIKESVDTLGWRFVALSRLLPVIPFSVLNYSFGLTNISFFVYLINTMIFIIPVCTIYSYLGETGHHIFDFVVKSNNF